MAGQLHFMSMSLSLTQSLTRDIDALVECKIVFFIPPIGSHILFGEFVIGRKEGFAGTTELTLFCAPGSFFWAMNVKLMYHVQK